MKNRFRIAHTPKFTDQIDINTWHKLENYLGKYGDAIFLDLVIRCSTHDHAAGGEGFINYCIKKGWLVKLDLNEIRYTQWRSIEDFQVVEDIDNAQNQEIQVAENTDFTLPQGIS